MFKRVLLVIIGVLILGVGGGLYGRFFRPRWQVYQDEGLGISFSWPDNFQVMTLTDSEKESGVVWKLARPKPEAQVFLRFEGDLGPIRFTGKTILDYLVETIDRTYPGRFPEFYKKDQRQFVLAGQNAAELVFSYRSPAGETRILQRYIVIVRDEENTAFFLSCQAPEEEFSRSAADFERMVISFSFLP